jgi:hypothetical protein
MATLPALSITDRHTFKALALEQSQILHPGLVWFCRGRTVICSAALRSLNVFAIPRNATAMCVAADDFEAVKEWLK